MRHYNVFDIGENHDYFDMGLSEKEFMRAAAGYKILNKAILEILGANKGFKASFSISGTFLEMCEKHSPILLASFRDLLRTGRVELLAGTYHNSLASLFSEDEFKHQVKEHKKILSRLFGISPEVFRNTGLIYDDKLSKHLDGMGFRAAISEGASHLLGWRSPDYIYSDSSGRISLLLRNYKLSDDLALRFGDKSWDMWPLSPKAYAAWINRINGNGVVANLFMNYDALAYHSGAGMLAFLKRLVPEVLSHKDDSFMTPSEAAARFKPVSGLNVAEPVSWGGADKRLDAWQGNRIQAAALKRISEIRPAVMASGDASLAEDWRRLSAADSFRMMSTAGLPSYNYYKSPYDTFINLMNITKDMMMRAGIRAKPEPASSGNANMPKKLKA